MNSKLVLCKKLSMKYCFLGHSGTRFRCNPIKSFSSKELLEATNNFKPYFYNDSDYKWYKATLDDRPVLIKRYDVSDYKFAKAYRDIAISTQMSSHKNVLKLFGCCLELRHPALVYEYAENGPFDNKGGIGSNGLSLTWNMRLKVAKGIANAITYLHTSFPRPIIHRDLKLSSMFLDKDFVPKLSNFALSLSIPEGKTHVRGTTVQGTVGFVDPAYLRTSVVTVYSFGVFLLVLLTGQSAFDHRRARNQQSIHAYVAELVKEERFDEIVDPKILEGEGRTNIEELDTQLRAFLKLASSCIETKTEDRPLMIDVAKEIIKIERTAN
ncbi:hypothetical protein TIFTF001_035362 [Ficus carica]|uniref:Protein kinase domain-containing protein n=1 Tax=Ficus carica TaxID=3494 RepID=A0AA88E1V1_FICCA|nr:hypothetical protein TIFTF001_035362 [Ficus carica]